MGTHRTNRITRRQFAVSTISAAGAAVAAPAILRGQNLNSKVGIALVGCGGRGGANGQSLSSENIAAVCDVNGQAVEGAGVRFPRAKKYKDFRQMLDDKGAKDFDAVVVSCPEHTHALATMLALRQKKHVYCEKPLTHNVQEARQVRLAAAEAKVVTQMGIQNHARENYRRVVELIQGGVIGPVREAHVWVSRAWGLQSEEAAERNRDIVKVANRPTGVMEPPAYLDWDLWLGPAPERPFHSVYFPGPKWYRWWDFGNGTMSDLGSHWNDLPFWALKLQAPLTVAAHDASGNRGMPHPEIAPASMSCTYEYGSRGDGFPPVKLVWHQGENKPQIWKDGGIPKWGDGHLFIGEKGMLLSSYDKHVLLPEETFKDAKLPDPWLPRVPGHHEEWVQAIRNGKQASANFQYSGWLTEANHLGNVAFRAGKKLQWDPEKLRATNAPEADQYIRRAYRKGWSMEGIG
jgi:predicted dehydrogenase